MQITETINGVDIRIDVDAAGIFRADFDEEQFRAESLAALKVDLAKAVKKHQATKPVDVTVINLRAAAKTGRGWHEEPFEEGRGAIHAKLRKRHDRQSKYLLTSSEGTKFDVSTYGQSAADICRRLTPEEVATYLALAQHVDDAEADLEAFRISVQLDCDAALGKGAK